MLQVFRVSLWILLVLAVVGADGANTGSTCEFCPADTVIASNASALRTAHNSSTRSISQHPILTIPHRSSACHFVTPTVLENLVQRVPGTDMTEPSPVPRVPRAEMLVFAIPKVG